MAIDSAQKRKSAAMLGFAPLPVVTPNASPDAAWRLEAAGNYSGIAAGTPPVSGRLMGSLAGAGGLAGRRGGLAA